MHEFDAILPTFAVGTGIPACSLHRVQLDDQFGLDEAVVGDEASNSCIRCNVAAAGQAGGLVPGCDDARMVEYGNGVGQVSGQGGGGGLGGGPVDLGARVSGFVQDSDGHDFGPAA